MFVFIVILVLVIIILLIGIHQKNTNKICRSKKRLEGKTAVITGGTAGMGLEIARDFAERGARVIIGSPFPTEGEQAVEEITRYSDNQEVVFKLLDLASFKSTRNFAANILSTEDRLDILVNNAGVGGPFSAVSHDGLNFVMQVNYYGAILLTMLLLPLLKKSGRLEDPSRIINISSASYILGRTYLENTVWCRILPISYFTSKLYLVMFSRELANRLKHCNVVANIVDPGIVGTNLFFTFYKIPFVVGFFKAFFKNLFKQSWEGAQTAIYVALDKNAGSVSGAYFKNCKQIRIARIARNKKLSEQLWMKSVALVKLSDIELGYS